MNIMTQSIVKVLDKVVTLFAKTISSEVKNIKANNKKRKLLEINEIVQSTNRLLVIYDHLNRLKKLKNDQQAVDYLSEEDQTIIQNYIDINFNSKM